MTTVSTTLTVTLSSDLHLGVNPTRDTVRRTLGHIPGSVVRGAYASAWIRRYLPGPHPSVPASGALRDEFVALFEGGVRFAPLFYGRGPTRLSVLAHKYKPEPGCVPEWDQAEADADHSARKGLTCLTCNQVLEPAKGEIPAPPATRRGHTERDSDGTAKDGQLFARESLRRRQGRDAVQLSGHLVARDQTLVDALRRLEPSFGGRRTSHGLAATSIDPVASPGSRIQDGRFVVTLNSPGVFVDGQGYPMRRPDPVEIATVLGLPTDDVSVVECWTRWADEGGWHAASGLPKPNELAVAAGSTYVVEAAGASEAGLDQLWRRGLGLRRHEGFGDLR